MIAAAPKRAVSVAEITFASRGEAQTHRLEGCVDHSDQWGCEIAPFRGLGSQSRPKEILKHAAWRATITAATDGEAKTRHLES